jgi:hypothetical protein
MVDIDLKSLYAQGLSVNMGAVTGPTTPTGFAASDNTYSSPRG